VSDGARGPCTWLWLRIVGLMANPADAGRPFSTWPYSSRGSRSYPRGQGISMPSGKDRDELYLEGYCSW
jgi:hypothetical protein